MKTNPSARRIRKFRGVLGCLAIAAIVGVELWLGQSVVSRIAHTTGRQTDSPAVPNVNISDLIASAR